jgi:NhaP-type Na+/H+ or K+/H+ antiporter
MLLMWGAGTLISGIALGLPLLTALMVGAAIAPTDPVLSAPLLTGRLAERAVQNTSETALLPKAGSMTVSLSPL